MAIDLLSQPQPAPTSPAPAQPAPAAGGGPRDLLGGNPLSSSFNTPDPKKNEAAAHTILGHLNDFFQTLGGKDSFLGKIGSALGEGEKSGLTSVAETGVSGYNALAAIPKAVSAIKQGKMMPKDTLSQSRNVPLLGKVKPAITGDETAGQFAGSVLSHGVSAAGVIGEGEALGGTKAAIKGVGAGVKDLLAKPTSESEILAGAKKVGSAVKTSLKKIGTNAAKEGEETAKKSLTLEASDLTKGEYGKAGVSGKLSGRTLGKSGAPKVDSETEKLAVKYKDLLQSSDPIKNANSVKINMDTKAKEVGDFVAKNEKTANITKLKDKISESLHSVRAMGVSEDKVNKMVSEYVDLINKGSKGEKKVASLSDVFADRNAFTTSKDYVDDPTVQKKLNQAARRGIKDYIESELPKSGAKYKKIMDELHDMFDIQSVLKEKIEGEKGLSTAGKFYKKNKGKIKAGAAIVGGAATVAGIDKTIKATTGVGY